MTKSPNFLRSIAEYFTAGVSSRPPASTLTFILPNKRSALFLKKHLRERSRGVTLMPRIMTIGTFLGIYSEYPAAQPRELLFVLYDAYRNVLSRKGRADEVRQFDGFVFWGDMMLNDFDDIDKSLVDANDIFRNLKNIKEIQADYLDEDQKEIIRRIWGESRLTAHIEEFWLHLGNCEEKSLSRKFVYLWEILAEIYHEYKAALKRNHRASEGTLFRLAVENVKNYDLYDFTGDTRYVFVGFNDLTAAETIIFERFKRAGVAYYFWDTAPLTLFAGAKGTSMPRPLQRLADLVRHFPMPDDYTVPMPDALPEISLTAVASNVAQTKCIGMQLKKWIDNGYIDPANALNTAIVLPDQGLLLPALLAIPSDIEALNISMSLAYRTTTFASLLHSIISMQLRARKIRGEYCFYYEDLNAVLSHPHIQAIAAEAANKVTKFVNLNKLYNAGANEICNEAEELKAVFTPVHKAASVREVAEYLGNLLDWLGAALRENIEKSGQELGKSFELEALKYFREELDKLTELIERHNVEMADHTFLYLFERIFATRGLTLTGTPLKGMQVLGILETRAIDFENVIILSMNEGVFPRKQYAKTMIPNNLRTGFGLPDFDSPEWTFAYSFYRLISRAKHVALFYDSRTDGVGQGEKSRYISQLQYLVPQLNISEHTLSTGSEAGERHQFSISKNPRIMDSLARYRKGGKKKLSASALKKYLECPFRFYLEYVRDMHNDDEIVESLTAAEIGTIVHNSIQSLYEDHKLKKINAALIDSWLDEGNSAIHDAVVEQIRQVHSKSLKTTDFDSFTTELKIAATNIEILVRSNLEAERNSYCETDFIFIENEYKVNTIEENISWKLSDTLDLNFYMSIDRVDEIAPNVRRFIDFKTGVEETSISDLNNIFTSYKNEKGGIFQLLLYCEAYMSLRNSNVDIQPVLHPLRKLVSSPKINFISVGKTKGLKYSQIRDTFRPLLIDMLERIFDDTTPFVQCEDTSACKYCPFLPLCGRSIKKY